MEIYRCAATSAGVPDSTLTVSAMDTMGSAGSARSFLVTQYFGHEYLASFDAVTASYFADAEKTLTDADDDNLCWAASAANMLQWAGWGGTFADEDRILDYFVSLWPDEGGWQEQGISWWINGRPFMSAYYYPASGGNFFPGLTPENYLTRVITDTYSDVTSLLKSYFEAGQIVGANLQGAIAHAITFWGYKVENGVFSVYYTDSDDDKNVQLADRRDAVDSLKSSRLLWDNVRRCWYLADYHDYGNSVYLHAITSLEQYDPVFSGKSENRASAATLEFSGDSALRYGNLDAAADIDYYRIGNAQDRMLSISVSARDTAFAGKLYLTVYAADGSVIFKSEGGVLERYALRPPTGGELYFSVSGTPDGRTTVGANTYAVTVEYSSDTTPPAAPGELTAAREGNQYRFSWNASADESTVEYYFEYSTDANFTPGKVQGRRTSDTSLLLSLSDGLYYWRVRAIDAVYLESPITTAATPVRVDLTPPSFPQEIAVDGAGSDWTFRWSAVSDTSGVQYELEIASASSFADSVRYSTGNTYQNLTLADGTYHWRVRAVDGAGNAGNWKVADSTLAIDVTPPPVPMVRNTILGKDSVTLAWYGVAADDFLHYQVRYADNETMQNAEIRATKSISVGIGAYPAGMLYWQVRSVDRRGNVSDWSAMSNFLVRLSGPESLFSWTQEDSLYLQWGGKSTERYEVTLSRSYGGEAVYRWEVTGGGTQLVNPPEGNWYWQIRNITSEPASFWSSDSEPVLGGSGKAATVPAVFSGSSTDDLLLTVLSESTWGSAFALRRADDGRTVSLRGYRRSLGTYCGQTGHDVLLLDDRGVALLLDDSFSATAAPGTPRIAGIEEIRGGAGHDLVDLTSSRYEYGPVTIRGGAGNDVLWSGAGADVLYGGEGNDWLNGGMGNDWLCGDAGDDLLEGGGGDDTFFFAANWGVDRVSNLPGAEITLAFGTDVDAMAIAMQQDGGNLILQYGENRITVLDRTESEITLRFATDAAVGLASGAPEESDQYHRTGLLTA